MARWSPWIVVAALAACHGTGDTPPAPDDDAMAIAPAGLDDEDAVLPVSANVALEVDAELSVEWYPTGGVGGAVWYGFPRALPDAGGEGCTELVRPQVEPGQEPEWGPEPSVDVDGWKPNFFGFGDGVSTAEVQAGPGSVLEHGDLRLIGPDDPQVARLAMRSDGIELTWDAPAQTGTFIEVQLDGMSRGPRSLRCLLHDDGHAVLPVPGEDPVLWVSRSRRFVHDGVVTTFSAVLPGISPE